MTGHARIGNRIGPACSPEPRLLKAARRHAGTTQDDEEVPVTVFRVLDEAVIDRVFQPAVNRLQVSDVVHAAIPCYALFVGAQIGRAVVLHAQGLLGGRAPEIAAHIAVACFIYVGGVLNSRDAPSRPNPIRHSPVCRSGRLFVLLLALGGLAAAPFVWPVDAETLLSWGGSVMWGAGMYFEACESPPRRPKCKAVPNAVPNTA